MGTNFLKLLTLLFIGLKLTGFIGWSWWFVTMPLMVSFLLFLVVELADKD